MIVNSHLFEAFLECSTKCWLRSRAEPTAGNIYAEWARAQSKAYCEGGLRRLLAMFPENDRAIAPPISQYARDVTWRFASDVRVRIEQLGFAPAGSGKIARRRAGKIVPVRPISFSIR